jgi:putative hydrolase of the HAD superfamily
MVIRGVVFDIDDTLYDERDYVRSGFRHIAEVVGRSDDERAAIAGWLDTAFASGRRGDTFDRLIDRFPEIAERWPVASLIEAYRRHAPAIALAPDIASTIDTLRDAGLRLAVLSDGPLPSQAAKAGALGLDRWFDPIVFTEAFGPSHGKPATTGFEAIARAWALPHDELVYVADNPEKDFIGPRALGWRTVRLRHPAQLRHELEPTDAQARPDVEIASVGDLVAILNRP